MPTRSSRSRWLLRQEPPAAPRSSSNVAGDFGRSSEEVIAQGSGSPWPGRSVARWTPAGLVMAIVLGAGWAGSDADTADARRTRPTLVALDFHDRTIGEVLKEIANRSGKRVVPEAAFPKTALSERIVALQQDTSWMNRKVTLKSPQPVPFWEAIDRLAEAGRLGYRLAEGGDPGAAALSVAFTESGAGPGLACYAGPFRVGLHGVHEYHEVLLVRGRWVQILPSGLTIAADASELSTAPKDGGPLFVELNVAAEPGLICRRNGPLQGLEASDESGRSLAAPLREDEHQSFQAFTAVSGGFEPVVRIPLKRVEGKGSKNVLKRLRGVIPVELGVLKAEPAVVIRLGDSESKVLRGGGVVFTVEKNAIEAEGRLKLALSCRLDHDERPAPREARLAALRTYQLHVVDAQGAPARFTSSSSGGDGRGTLTFTYEYAPGPPDWKPPAELRYYDLDRVAWQVPFAFDDIPLP